MIIDKNWFKFLKIVLVLLALWVPVSWLLADFLVVEKPLENPDALVVLGGSAEYLERTAMASALFKQGKARYIVITNDGRQGGWNEKEQRNPYFVENARAALIASGISAEVLLTPTEVPNGTDEEAATVLRFAASRGFSSIQLVTSPYHTRRALMIFESNRADLGLSCAIGISTDRGGPLDPSSHIWWLSPTAVEIVVSEYAKMIYFWITK